MIFVGVGTFVHGFDALVEAADQSAAALQIPGFAQIGHSSVVPLHLEHARFLPPEELRERLAASRVAVCHAGMGLIGDALRAGCRLILVPRRGTTTRHHPANDQTSFAELLAQRLPLRLCLEPADLASVIKAALADSSPPPSSLGSSVPAILQQFLKAGAKAQSRPAASS